MILIQQRKVGTEVRRWVLKAERNKNRRLKSSEHGEGAVQDPVQQVNLALALEKVVVWPSGVYTVCVVRDNMDRICSFGRQNILPWKLHTCMIFANTLAFKIYFVSYSRGDVLLLILRCLAPGDRV